MRARKAAEVKHSREVCLSTNAMAKGGGSKKQRLLGQHSDYSVQGGTECAKR